jgi:LPXTG-motif cell wall-anchored protein
MNKARWVSAAVGTAVLVAGFAWPASAAFADSGPNGDSGVLSVLSGNDVNAPVSLPADVCGVAVSLLGGANAGCAGGAASNTVIHNGGGSGGGNGNAGVISAGSGNTLNLPVSAPVSVCGVSGAAAGFSNSGCKGGAASNTVINGGGSGGGNGNAGGISALSGNTVNAPVSVPVNVCGIAVALLGFSNAGCQGGSVSNVTTPPPGGGQPTPGPTPCPTPPPTCQCTPPPSTPPSTPPTTPPGTGTPPTTPPSTPPSTPPGNGTPPSTPPGNGTPPGNQGGGTTTVPGSLPITGADLLGMGIAAVGALGIGGASLVIARRRRNGEV